MIGFAYKMVRLDVSRFQLRICNVDVVTQRAVSSVSSPDNSAALASEKSAICSTRTVDDQIEQRSRVLDHYKAPVASDALLYSRSRSLKAATTKRELSAILSPLDELYSTKAEGSLTNSQIRVETTSVPVNQCDHLCVCQCHRFTNLVSPNALSQVIGKLFIGYVGLPLLNSRKCNRVSCRRKRNRMEIRVCYLFPVWFVLRFIALTITKASTTFMWKLSVPVVTETTAPMLVFTSLGDTRKIQALLGSDDGILNAVDAVANKSALHVSECKGSRRAS